MSDRILEGPLYKHLQVPASLLAVFAFRLGAESLWVVISTTYLAYALLYVWSYQRGRYLRTAIAT